MKAVCVWKRNLSVICHAIYNHIQRTSLQFDWRDMKICIAKTNARNKTNKAYKGGHLNTRVVGPF